MRFVMLVPKSLDPAPRAARLPVPDPRPSEKIARLFPQTDQARPAEPAKAEAVAIAGPIPLPVPRPSIEPTPEPRRQPKSRPHRQ
jgi:membrane-bound lytic murein transglycosylase A